MVGYPHYCNQCYQLVRNRGLWLSYFRCIECMSDSSKQIIREELKDEWARL